MKSLLLLKKSYLFLLLKKNILICQNTRSALWDVKKRFCDVKNSDLFCYIKKKKEKIFDDKSSVLFLLYILKKDFLRRKLRS